MSINVYKTCDVSEEEFNRVLEEMKVSTEDDHGLFQEHFRAVLTPSLPRHIKSARMLMDVFPEQLIHSIIIDSGALRCGKVLVYAPWLATEFYHDNNGVIEDLPDPEMLAVDGAETMGAEDEWDDDEDEDEDEDAWGRDGLFRFPADLVCETEALTLSQEMFYYIDECSPLPDGFPIGDHWD
jgi:hypothetical protein